MASKGAVGIDLDVAKVPLREADMEPFEIMVSESQERMLCVIEPAQLSAVLSVCEKWEVDAAAIGEVTDSGQLRVFQAGELVGDMPVAALVDECPRYSLSPQKPAQPIYPQPRQTLPTNITPRDTLLALLGGANLSSRRWVFEQYDSLVGSRTIRVGDETDAAVLLLDPQQREGARPAIAVSIDGNGRRTAVDPYRGAAEAVLECASNLACVGAEPVGLTNCLNFGNPEKPHVAWQLERAVAGLADTCRALDVPVVGGNVSLYNEHPEGPIYPTPVVGMVGELPDARHAGQVGFANEGDTIAIVRAPSFNPSMQGSELAKLRGEPLDGELPEIDIAEFSEVAALIRHAVRNGLLHSVHDISDGGFTVAVAECCLAGGIGAVIEIPDTLSSDESFLFGECRGAFVVSAPESVIGALDSKYTQIIGTTGGDGLVIRASSSSFSIALGELKQAHQEGLVVQMGLDNRQP